MMAMLTQMKNGLTRPDSSNTPLAHYRISILATPSCRRNRFMRQPVTRRAGHQRDPAILAAAGTGHQNRHR